MLFGLGEEAYGELIGHHLNQGFAVPRRLDRGLEWLAVAVTALEGGATPLVTANSSQRTALLRQAVATASGQTAGSTLSPASSPAGGHSVSPTPQPSVPY